MKPSAFPRLALGLALVVMLGLGASSLAPEASGETASGESVTAVSATHQVKIEYLDTEGDYRRAKISIAPLRDGARAPWRGELRSVHVAGLKPVSPREATAFREKGFTQMAEFLSSGHTTGSNILMPAPNNLRRIWLRGERGSIVSFRIWTRTHNPSTTRSGDEDDTPPKEDPAPDAPDPDADEECGPIPSGCEVYNPFTCECDIGLEDPWGNEAQFEGLNGGFSF